MSNLLTVVRRPIGWVAMVIGLAGCATSGGAEVAYLLEQNYQTMTNAELTAYEQELSEEIARSYGSSGAGGTSIGFGLGSWGSNTGFGLGIEQALGGGGGAPVELRDRREAVRVEMRGRGLLPPDGGGQ